MSATHSRMSRWSRRAFLFAAFLALVLQLMVPAGFMIAAPDHAGGFPIVICSAQGQTVVDWAAVSPGSDAHKSKAPAKSMAGCPFAGHATAAEAPTPGAIAVPAAFTHAAPTGRAYAVFPGRGLAAPPPPAIGPPLSA